MSSEKDAQLSIKNLKRYKESNGTHADLITDELLLELNNLTDEINFPLRPTEDEEGLGYPVEWVSSEARVRTAIKIFERYAAFKIATISENKEEDKDKKEKEKEKEKKNEDKKAEVEKKRAEENETPETEKDVALVGVSMMDPTAWPEFNQIVGKEVYSPSWIALASECKYYGCDFMDVAFRLELRCQGDDGRITPADLLRFGHDWLTKCPDARLDMEKDFWGNKDLKKTFDDYRKSHPRRVPRHASPKFESRWGSPSRIREQSVFSENPQKDREEVGFANREAALGWDSIILSHDPDVPGNDSPSVKGKIHLIIWNYLDVCLPSLGDPDKERHVLIPCKDYRDEANRFSKATEGKTRIFQKGAGDKTLKGCRRDDIQILYYVSAAQVYGGEYPQTYAIGFKVKERGEGIMPWSRGIFSHRFNRKGIVDTEINKLREEVGQKPITITPKLYILVDSLRDTARTGQNVLENRTSHACSEGHDKSLEPQSVYRKAVVPYCPVEIWHAITTWLDPFDKLSFLATHKGASGILTRQQLQHSKLWTAIFKNDTWISRVLSHGLQPVVIGRQLHNICGYMILTFAGDVSEIPDTLRDPNCLLRSLRSQAFSLGNLEVAFEQFTLNVCDILEPGNVIDMLNPGQLFTNRSGTAEISISYYRDTSSRIYSIRPLLATGELVVVSHQFEKGRQHWAIRLQSLEPEVRRFHQHPVGISQEWFLARMKELSTNS